ncbi:MAG: TetR/AcrR family transcriptional regulator [Myxococcota bacterium]
MGRTSDAQEKIVEAACALFHQRGYQAVGVQEICDAAGVKKGSFYHFFRSKQELALAMLDAMWERVQEEELGSFRDERLPPLERIRRYLEIAPEIFDARRTPEGALCGCPFGNMALEMSTHDDAIRRRLDQIYRGWAGHLQHALDQAVERGDLPPFDTARAAESVVAFISGLAVLAKTRNSMAGAETLQQTVLGLIHPELAARVPQAPVPAQAG